MSGRVLAIGDIHGCHQALVSLLDVVSPSPTDTVVIVGDAVDRGPSSRQVIDEILALHDKCNVVFIMGNHEEMMRNAISGSGWMNAWLESGGRETLDSYGGTIDKIPAEHIRFLLSARSFWESETDVFVHACLEHDVTLPNQTSSYLRWTHVVGSERPHASGKRVVCGHTSQKNGLPLVFDGWACIDTFAHGGQWLSCLDVKTNHIYQTSQKGATRNFPLSRYT